MDILALRLENRCLFQVHLTQTLHNCHFATLRHVLLSNDKLHENKRNHILTWIDTFCLDFAYEVYEKRE